MAGRVGLIGHTGFVGSTLENQTQIDARYRSTDIHQIRGQHFDLLICAGASAKKWLANADPDADKQSIRGLIAHLTHVSATKVVLISTVDVFSPPVGIYESSEPGGDLVTPYGQHRLELERALSSAFDSLIVRLPGLVGPGLRKNALYDLAHHNELSKIDSRGIFQFYPMVNLWADLSRALELGVKVVHLTAAPLKVRDIACDAFAIDLENELPGDPAVYDLRSEHAGQFGGAGNYQYSARESLLAIRTYAQGELLTARAE